MRTYDLDFSIRLKNINFFYKGLWNSKSLGISGPSGSGKSTFTKALLGHINPLSIEGSLKVDEHIFYNSQKKIYLPPEKRGYSWAPQSPYLIHNLNIYDNIVFSNPNADKEKLGFILELLEINDIAYEKPTKISGGQKQRAILARSFISPHSHYIFDESFSFLDKRLKKKIKNHLLNELESSSTSLIMISHNREDLESLCDFYIEIENRNIKY